MTCYSSTVFHWSCRTSAISLAILLAFAQPCAAFTPQDEDKPVIVNGDFAQWEDGKPVGWQVEIGASNGGDAPRSRVFADEGPSVALAGSAETLAWNLLSQSIDASEGDCLRMSYRAKTKDVRREGRQFNNCYVGFFAKNASGQFVVRQVRTVDSDNWGTDSLVLRMPAGTVSGQIMIFLSKSGQLNVTDVSLERLAPEQSFQLLVDDMRRNYSYFDVRGVDWDELSERYRDRAEGAADASDFSAVVVEMLGELRDLHVWVSSSSQQRIPTYRSGYDANYNYSAVTSQLAEVQRFGRLGMTGRTEEGFGVVVVSSLAGAPDDLARMLTSIESLFDAPGIIVDLRANGGGAEPMAQQIAARFADRQRVYAKHRFRSGPDSDDFTPDYERLLTPAEGKRYAGPVACLIGPGCVSSGEGFAAMMACLPKVTMVGQPTRGASGNPQPIALPNGIDIWYSRWQSLLPDGSTIEGVGIQPDIAVEHTEDGDATFDAGRKLLREESN